MVTIEELRASAEQAAGMYYETSEAKAILGMWPGDEEDWTDYYPEVDGYGNLTGQVIGADERGFAVVDNDFMVETSTLSTAEQKRIKRGYFPIWVVED